ncbi:hypothetical protein GOBAR_DD10343 [Gossypium barbadense]|nr:hypothetical protein GOBAR_DD10343 [Gossypium barbadense]
MDSSLFDVYASATGTTSRKRLRKHTEGRGQPKPEELCIWEHTTPLPSAVEVSIVTSEGQPKASVFCPNIHSE